MTIAERFSQALIDSEQGVASLEVLTTFAEFLDHESTYQVSNHEQPSLEIAFSDNSGVFFPSTSYIWVN